LSATLFKKGFPMQPPS